MLVFDPNDPYPLLPHDSHSYQEAQRHSAQVDAWLGLETEKVENWLCENAPITTASTTRQELWVGLPVQALLTPYTEIRSILDKLQPRKGQTVVDLGAGYGRIGFVLGRHYPDVGFIGYEYVKERVEEANRGLSRLNYPRTNPLIKMQTADLSSSSFTPEPAAFYFLYDYGSQAAIDKTLGDLQAIAESRAITVVGRGRSSRNLIERQQPWLSQVIAPMHYEHYSIYRSAIEA